MTGKVITFDASGRRTDNLTRDGRRNGSRGGPVNEFDVTVKEEKFAQLVAAGANRSEAYEKAYDTSKMQPQTKWRRAYDVGNRPAVKRRVAMLCEESQDSDIADTARAKAFIVERLWIEASDAKSRPGDRLKAIELLGKLEDVGAFREKSEVITKQDAPPEVLRQRIEELIKKAS